MMRNTQSMTHCKRWIHLMRRQWNDRQEGPRCHLKSTVINTGSISQVGPVRAIVKRSGPLYHATAHPCSSAAHTPQSSSSDPIKDGKLSSTRTMSTINTKGSRPPASPHGALPAKGSTSVDKWREFFNEKQSDYKRRFANVKESPQPTNQQWYKPDPMTGFWVPMGYHGQVMTTPEAARKSSLPTVHVRTESSLDKEWFENLEELPDMERKPLNYTK